LKKESLKVALLTFVLPEQASQEKIFSLLIMNLGFQKSLFLLLAFTRIPFLLFWSAFHNKNKLREYKYLRRCFFHCNLIPKSLSWATLHMYIMYEQLRCDFYVWITYETLLNY
jgi:hypothetical protein